MLPKVSAVTEPKLYPDSAPPSPATKAASPNASILVPATLTPTAAAARSLDRTASIWRPVTERRTLTTISASTSTTIRQKTPKKGLGSFPSPKRGHVVRPELQTEQVRRRDVRPAEAAVPRRVLEDEGLDRDGEGERHHRQVDPAHPQRGDRGEKAEPGGRRGPEQRPEGERDVPVGDQLGEREPGHAGQRHLRE